ncbi:DUF4221 family protein [Cyclobacterium jeungdonense]|uniref:DUF4221 family protein n=1 Tax=Cyclobacterium jeungdonense TaxID=708087 RepID=A0ABT8C4S5_9BACT|nr:DUF4221 family protein [Cyclobacterium jeungdonense]MDN3687754.1 DUF4221 family protein [Cyclobacterium jeungdonense]
MKQIPLLILTMIGFSCGNKPETSTTDNLKIKIDTLMVDYQKVLEQVSFSPPVWDDENERYYRFSYRIEFAEVKEAGELLPEAIDRNIHLSVYNKDFALVAEAPVPQLVTNLVRYFVREGDIWIFENIADELGFIRLELTI